jgi:hypothetical protein
MLTEPRFTQGEPVILRSTIEEGRIIAGPIRDAGEYWYKVRFGKRVENVVEEDLDVVDDIEPSIEHLVGMGR